MKKNFYPHSFTWILFVAFLFGLYLLAQFCFVYMIIKQNYDIFSLVLLLCSCVFLIYESYVMIISYKITITNYEIFTIGDKFGKLQKVQYKTRINFTDIKNIKIIASSKDSRNKKIPLSHISSAIPKKYLEFELAGGGFERIIINHYTKKQIIKLLNYVKEKFSRIQNNDCIKLEEIMKQWYSYGGYKKLDTKK